MHTLLVAAIFTVFILGMGSLIAVATWTGGPREGEDEQDPGRLPAPEPAA